MDIPQIVPQLFYDLIARVIPGAIAILTLAAALQLRLNEIISVFFETALGIQQSSFVSAAAFLIAAYVIGHLIVPFSDLLKRLLSRADFQSSFHLLKKKMRDSNKNETDKTNEFLLKELKYIELLNIEQRKMQQLRHAEEKVIKSNKRSISLKHNREKVIEYKKAIREKEKAIDKLCTDALWLWYDWLRIKNPDVGARLTKLRAEYEMHRAIASIFIIAFIAHWIAWGIYSLEWWTQAITLNPPFLIATIVAFFLSVIGVAKTYWRFQLSTINHYYVAKEMPIDDIEIDVKQAGSEQ